MNTWARARVRSFAYDLQHAVMPWFALAAWSDDVRGVVAGLLEAVAADVRAGDIKGASRRLSDVARSTDAPGVRP